MIPNKINPFGYNNSPKPLINPVDGELILETDGGQSGMSIIRETGWYRGVATGCAGYGGTGPAPNGGRASVILYLYKGWAVYMSSANHENTAASPLLRDKFGTGDGGAGWPNSGNVLGQDSILGGGGAGGDFGRGGGGGGGPIGRGGTQSYKGGWGGGGGAIIIYDGNEDRFGWNTNEPFYYTRARNPQVGDDILDGTGKPIPGMTVGATTISDKYVNTIQIMQDGVLQPAISVNDNAPDIFRGFLFQDKWKYLILASGGGGGYGGEGSGRRGGASGGAGTNGGRNTGNNKSGGLGGYTGVKSADGTQTAINGQNTGNTYATGANGVGNAFDVRNPKRPILLKTIGDKHFNSVKGLCRLLKQVEG